MQGGSYGHRITSGDSPLLRGLFLFSKGCEDVKSENSQDLKLIDMIFRHLQDSGINAMDRGEDRRIFYKKYLREKKPKRFVIRLVDRDLIHHGRRRNCCELSRVLSTLYGTVLIGYEEGKEKKRTAHYNAVPVKIPSYGHGHKLYFVVVKGFGEEPMMLLTSCLVEKNRMESIWKIEEYYLARWKCDESFRYIKQCYNFRTFGFKAISALGILWFWCWRFLVLLRFILGKASSLRCLLKESLSYQKRFFWVPSFFNYAIADGIFNLFFPDKTALQGIKKWPR